MLPGGGKPERIVSLCRTIKNRDKTLLESISVHVLDRISDLICSLSYSLSCVVFQDIQDTKHLLSRISLDLYMQKKKNGDICIYRIFFVGVVVVLYLDMHVDLHFLSCSSI